MTSKGLLLLAWALGSIPIAAPLVGPMLQVKEGLSVVERLLSANAVGAAVALIMSSMFSFVALKVLRMHADANRASDERYESLLRYIARHQAEQHELLAEELREQRRSNEGVVKAVQEFIAEVRFLRDARHNG